MTQNIKIYNLQDRDKNSFILITGAGCQCEGSNNLDIDNNQKVKDSSSSKENQKKILPSTIIANNIKSKKKKNKKNKNKKNKETNKTNKIINTEDRERDSTPENKKIEDNNAIFSRQDFESNKPLNLNLVQVSEFYSQRDLNKLGPYGLVNINDKDIKYEEDEASLIFKPIIETKHKSCVGWIKDKNKKDLNEDESICVVIKNFKDIVEIKNVLSEITSSKKPDGIKNKFELIIAKDALKEYKEESLEPLKVLLINLCISVVCNPIRESNENTQDLEPKVLIRGLAKILNKSHNAKNKKNKNDENEINNMNRVNDVLSIFYKNTADSYNLLASAKQFKSEKNRKTSEKAAKFINKDVFKNSNLLKVKVLPFVEATSIIRTYDPVTSNNLNANSFNNLLEAVKFIKYSNYLEFNESEVVKTKTQKSNPYSLVTVRLNSELDITQNNKNNNYNGPLKGIHNSKEEIEKNLILNNKNIDSNSNTINDAKNEIMGTSEIVFD